MNKKHPPRTPSNDHFYSLQPRSYGCHKQISNEENSMNKSGYGGSSMNNNKTIQVSPGVHMILGDADETWQAVINDFYKKKILCIQDANYVLCPQCKVISPMIPFYECKPYIDKNNDGGVGIGFTMEDLAEWQDKIAYGQKMFVKQSNYFS